MILAFSDEDIRECMGIIWPMDVGTRCSSTSTSPALRLR